MFRPFLHPRSTAPAARLRGADHAGFTLLELLFVIAIVAVLAALLLTVFGRAQAQADSTACLSNLRQIGTAIAAYATDHDGYLPGPLSLKQSANFDDTTHGSLARLLEKYAGQSATSPGGGRESPIFFCPAARRQMPNRKTPSYLTSFVPVPGFGQTPWGDPALHQEPIPRIALTNLAEDQTGGHPLSLVDLWAIKDADQAYFREINAWTDSLGDLLPAPAHGNHRNALFHDLHVGRVEIILIRIAVTPPPDDRKAKTP